MNGKKDDLLLILLQPIAFPNKVYVKYNIKQK